MNIRLTPDKIACIRDMKRQVHNIEKSLRGHDVAISVVPELDTIMAGLDALLEPEHDRYGIMDDEMEAQA